MVERRIWDENMFTNVAFRDESTRSPWKEILKTSIEISDEIIIPGNFGIALVRGTFSRTRGGKKQSCSVKLLKGAHIILILIKQAGMDHTHGRKVVSHNQKEHKYMNNCIKIF
jgi:hypothetical protein